jgi:phosphate:Na+ symporter
MAKTLESKNIDKTWFTPKQRNNLNDLFELLNDAMQEMNSNLLKKSDQIKLAKAVDIETKINKLRDKLKTEHLKNIEKKGSNIRSGFLYVDLYSSGERLGDVIMSINDTLKSTPN